MCSDVPTAPTSHRPPLTARLSPPASHRTLLPPSRYRSVSANLLTSGGYFIASTAALLTAPLHQQPLLPNDGSRPFWLAAALDGVMV